MKATIHTCPAAERKEASGLIRRRFPALSASLALSIQGALPIEALFLPYLSNQ